MSDYLIILAGVVGLDYNSASDSKFIAYCVKDIRHLDAFIEYCEDHKESITFSKKTERLNTLAKRYKKIEDKALYSVVMKNASEYAKRLSNKVADVRLFVKNILEDESIKDCAFAEIVLEGKNYFDEHQINALNSIGGTSYIISLCEEMKLVSAIEEKFISSKKERKKYEMLPQGEKEIAKMLQVKKI